MTRRLVAEFANRAKEPHPAAELDAITHREREVMALVADGLTRMGEEVAVYHLGAERRATIGSAVALDPEGKRLHA